MICMSGLKLGEPILRSSFWSRITRRKRHDWKVTKMDLAKSDPERPYAKLDRLGGNSIRNNFGLN